MKKKKIIDIIRPKMTVLRYLHSKGMADAYFQNVCQAAFRYAYDGDMELYHPYSFAKMVSVYRAYTK